MPLFAAPILNIALRTATLGTRFALVFILAKYLDTGSVGYYGLFTAAISYALLCVGLDLYVYTTREIVKVETAQQGAILKSQAAIIGVLYLVLAPLALLLLPLTGFPTFLIWWFLPILILEHFNQELYRLLIILGQPLTASILLFLRQGSWALVAAALMIGSESSRSLNVVMLLWTLAGATAAVAGFFKIHKLRLGGWKQRVDWTWIKKGIAVSLTFLMATLALRAIQTFDRYWLERLAGIEFVGAYVFFFGIASALNTFLDAAVFSFRYPELITLSHANNLDEMRRKVRQMAIITATICLLFAAVSSFLLPILLSWIEKDTYSSEVYLYYWVLSAMSAFALSMVPHYGLYALGRDRAIITSHVAALFIFLLVTMGLAQVAGSYSVPIAVLVAMSVVLLWKTAAYLKFFHYDARRGDTVSPRSV